MKKIVTILTIALFSSLTAMSQIGVKGGYTMIQPLDENNDGLHSGFHIGLNYSINDNLVIELLAEPTFKNFNSFFISGSSRISPITIGAEYRFLTDRVRPYIGINTGPYIYGVKINNSTNSEAKFGLAPKLGAAIEVIDNLFVEVTAKYHAVFINSQNNNNNALNSYFGANIGLMYQF